MLKVTLSQKNVPICKQNLSANWFHLPSDDSDFPRFAHVDIGLKVDGGSLIVWSTKRNAMISTLEEWP